MHACQPKLSPDFTSCDWGTTHLRVRRVVEGRVVAEDVSENGVSRVRGNFSDVLRLSMKKIKGSPPVIVSGMAGSSIGWRELPYAELPFPLDGSGVVTCEIEPGIFLVSGVRGRSEVMRGEEVELMGLEDLPEDALVILPGTHSKHCQIRDGKLVAFQTHLTGELRQVIRTHTVLSKSVADGWDASAFCEGVARGSQNPLLGELFRVRTRQVLDGCPSESNGSYLDGLLIGSELSGIEPVRPLLVAAGNAQYLAYKTAIEALGLAPQTRILPPEETALLAVRGQSRLLHCKLLMSNC